jgi:hypothetical protein
MKRLLVGLGILVALIATAEVVAAQDVVAGWEGDDTRGYLFVAPTAATDLSASQSLLLRASASLLYYGSEADGPTDVRAPGVSLGIGYRLRKARVSAAVTGGYEVRRVHRTSSPSLPHAWEGGGSASGELFVAATRLTQVSAMAAYGAANRYVWSRAALKQQVTNRNFSGRRAVSLGVEATAQGNRDVSTYQVGTVVEWAWLGARSALQLRAGYGRSEFPDGRRQDRPYLGLGLYRAF